MCNITNTPLPEPYNIGVSHKIADAVENQDFIKAIPGVAFGMILLGERPEVSFYLGLAIMTVATILMIRDTIALQHTHEHTHAHRHGDLVHTHDIIAGHDHSHTA